MYVYCDFLRQTIKKYCPMLNYKYFLFKGIAFERVLLKKINNIKANLYDDKRTLAFPRVPVN